MVPKFTKATKPLSDGAVVWTQAVNYRAQDLSKPLHYSYVKSHDLNPYEVQAGEREGK